MKRAVVAIALIAFVSPLMLVGALLAVSEQTDPALAAGVGSADVRALLRSPNIALTSQARHDLQTGVVDQRLVSLLAWISQRQAITIGVFKTGHHKYVRGTDRVSNHYYGRSADITAVDGIPVSSSSVAARRVVLGIAGLSAPLRPDELGHPFGSIGFPGGFTDADHAAHIHIGYR